MIFWTLWGIDLIAAAIAVVFFVIGIGDGTVSSFNIGIWLLLLGGVAAVVVGSWMLRKSGRTAVAGGVAAVLAIPTFLYGLFLLVAITSGARWN